VTLVTPDNLMYSLPTILPPLYRNIRATITKRQGDIVGREYIKLSGVTSVPPVHENQLSKSNKLDAEAIWL
jgi:hypothetical protein